jgi:hypothetical protein
MTGARANNILAPRFFGAFLVAATLASVLSAQDGIQQAKIKRVDPAKGAVTLTVGGKDLDFTVIDSTLVMDAAGKPIK